MIDFILSFFSPEIAAVRYTRVKVGLKTVLREKEFFDVNGQRQGLVLKPKYMTGADIRRMAEQSGKPRRVSQWTKSKYPCLRWAIEKSNEDELLSDRLCYGGRGG